jgi:predicted HicB family RNase H-like nuclease
MTPAPAHNQERTTMTKKVSHKVQLVCRIDSALHAKVRTEATRAGQTLTAFVARALEKATGSHATTAAR